MVDQDWLINTQVSSTADPWLRKIEVEVAVDIDGAELSLVSLTGFKGRY